MEDKVYVVENNVCVVGNTLWETYCGIVGDNTHIVDEVLWRIMYILWTSDVNV